MRQATSLPAPVSDGTPRTIAELPVEPALIDDRLRVMGSDDRLWAEPLAGATGAAAVWSYRRVNARLGAFRITTDGSGRTLAVTAWDESPDRSGADDTGLLVGIDVATGAPVWRAVVPYPVSSTDGGVSYRSSDLLIVPARDGPVAVLTSRTRVEVVDATSGRSLWRYDQKSDCAQPPDFGPERWASGGYLVLNVTCGNEPDKPRLRVYDARSARLAAVLSPIVAAARPEVFASGCTDGVDCAVFGVSTGPAEVDPPLAWRLDATGRPRAVATDRDSLCCFTGDDRYLSRGDSVISLSPELHVRWSVAADDDRILQQRINGVDQGTGLVWLAAWEWRDGPAALVGLDPATGAIRTCAAPPKQLRQVEDVDAQGAYLVVGGRTYRSDGPDPAFVLLRPDDRPHPCPAA